MKTLVFATGAMATALLLSPPHARAADAVVPPAPKEAKAEVPPAQEPTLPSKTFVSPWVNEVLKLAQAGVDESVILAFIDSAGSFSVTSEQIVSLGEQGVAPVLVSAMMAHDAQIRAGVLPLPAPPPGPALSAAIKRLAPLPPPLPKPKAEPETIINPSPAPEPIEIVVADAHTPEISTATAEQTSTVAAISPVVAAKPIREPRPVPLTDTIRVFRAAWRTPNVQILQGLPE